MPRLLSCLILVLSAAAPVCAQQERSPGQDLAERLRQFESWIILEEEAAPDPPFFRGELGFVGFIENRSRIRADRNNLVGSRLDDLEGSQGLDSSGVGIFSEVSLGAKVRGGADVLWFSRGGSFQRQEEEVVFDGVVLAQPGDLIQTRFEFLSLAGFVEWNAVYGETYRIGLLGGLRYFKINIDTTSVRGQLRPLEQHRDLDSELISPFFGGLLELTPFPVLSVYTRAQFIIWSWQDVGLRSTRWLSFRMGVTLRPIPDLFAISVEYRFLVLRAESSSGNRRVEGALTSNGLGISVSFSF